jgi:acetyl-CoA synthetase
MIIRLGLSRVLFFTLSFLLIYKFMDKDSSTLYPIPITESVKHVESFEEYKKLYDLSLKDPNKFWSEIARSQLDWFTPFSVGVKDLSFSSPIKWFPNGKLNAAYNCIDRHVIKNPHKRALIWISDDPKEEPKEISYTQLKDRVSQLSNWLLKSAKVKKGDVATIYMGMVPEIVVSVLACARIGVVHNVVFGGFSGKSLRERIIDSKSKVLITTNAIMRGGNIIQTNSNIIEATNDVGFLETILVFERAAGLKIDIPFYYKWEEEIPKMDTINEPEIMDSEDPLFLLYTSGSTGKPKGLFHTTAGYLTYSSYTSKLVFDLAPNDIIATFADVGWITGHSYIIYGPLINGVTSLMFEGIPTYPSPSRFWDIIDSFNVTQMYTAPTVIRLLKKYGLDQFNGKKLSSLKVIGTVGEPINPNAWIWYYDNVAKKGNAALVDTYWQTETGGHIITPLPFAIRCKPGSASFPFPGIVPVMVDPETGKEILGNNVDGVLCIKNQWPGIARGIWNDMDKFRDTYFSVFPGYFYTGDRAHRDNDGYYWIRGRADDVINSSAHRLSTAEIESAACTHTSISEAAALGKPDEIIGESIWLFCVLKTNVIVTDHTSLKNEIKKEIRFVIGPIATPHKIFFVSDLPKTRSGKIMRRLLRKLICGENDIGDTSTLGNPAIIDEIKAILSQSD